MKIAITCGHLQRDIEMYRARLEAGGAEVVVPDVPGQELAGQELIDAMAEVDGVIAGDDQFTADVLAALPGLKAISKWGIGLDGIDRPAAAERGIAVTNTPGMFGNEVAEQALGYLIACVRGLVEVDRSVREGGWPKPVGRSLGSLRACVLGLGNIGQSLVDKLLALGVVVSGVDPGEHAGPWCAERGVAHGALADLVTDVDVLFVTCPLNNHTRGIVDVAHHRRDARRLMADQRRARTRRLARRGRRRARIGPSRWRRSRRVRGRAARRAPHRGVPERDPRLAQRIEHLRSMPAHPRCLHRQRLCIARHRVTHRALVTGVCGGIGAAVAHAFLADDWEVLGIDRVSPIGSLEGLITYAQCDISDSAAVGETLARIVGDDPLHALVNNAAVQVNKALCDTTDEEWELVMNTNVRSAFLCMRGTHDALVAGRGAIVNVASVHAIATSANVGAYAASKGALVALTRAAAVELAEAGVRCNAVLPGAVDTTMLRDGLGRRPHPDGPDGNLQQLIDRTPLRAVATPDEIAASVMFLATNTRSSFITGQALTIDGGATAKLSTE